MVGEGADCAARSVRGKVAGIFGFGRIGQAIAQRLEAFGVTVRYYQRREVAGTRAVRSASLLALAGESDFLIICAPGGPATRHAVDAAVLDALDRRAPWSTSRAARWGTRRH